MKWQKPGFRLLISDQSGFTFCFNLQKQLNPKNRCVYFPEKQPPAYLDNTEVQTLKPLTTVQYKSLQFLSAEWHLMDWSPPLQWLRLAIALGLKRQHVLRQEYYI